MDLKNKLGQEFIFTTELGGINGTLIGESIEKAKNFQGLNAINVHDCPNARLRMNSVMAASILQRELGITTIAHFTCRDRSILGTQADLLGAHALGIRYILVTTGDGPRHGPYKSSPVYDYNSKKLISIIKGLNRAQDANGSAVKGNTEFTVSATVTPGASNLETEIKKMVRKIEAGADFFQTQAMYEVDQTRVFLERARPLGRPIILGVMPLKSLKMAEFVNGGIRGITVPERILNELGKGKTGFEIACDFIEQVYQEVDGLHIFGMGDVATTNKIIQFTKGLLYRG